MDDGAGRQRNRAIDIQGGFDEHEPRVEGMLAEAANASPEIGDAVRRAARLFWRSADGVNEMATTELNTHGDEVPEDALRGYREAKSTTEECVEILRQLDAPVRDAEN